MDSNTNVNHLINLLLSTARDGAIAEDFRAEIEHALEEIVEAEGVVDALSEGVTAFVNAILPMAMATLGLDEEDERLLVEILGTSYGTGITFGISIGILAREAAEG